MTPCTYCGRASKQRIDEMDDSGVCDGCWALLQDPGTALPLMRGHLTMSMRGRIPPQRLASMVEAFMEAVARRMGRP